MTYSTSCCSFD